MSTEWHANVQVKWNYFFRVTAHNGGSVCLLVPVQSRIPWFKQYDIPQQTCSDVS